jgi:hypothetical protein
MVKNCNLIFELSCKKAIFPSTRKWCIGKFFISQVVGNFNAKMSHTAKLNIAIYLFTFVSVPLVAGFRNFLPIINLQIFIIWQIAISKNFGKNIFNYFLLVSTQFKPFKTKRFFIRQSQWNQKCNVWFGIIYWKS